MSPIAWLRRRLRPAEGWLIFVFLVVAALSAAATAMEAKWVPGDALFWHTALVAALLGRALGRTRIRRGWAALLLAVAGVIYVGWGVTHLTAPLWEALAAAWRGSWPLAGTWLREVGGRLAMLAGEIAAWVSSWVGPGRSPDPIVSLSWMALLLWGGAARGGWSVARGRHPFFSFLPLAGILTLSVYFSGQGEWYAIVFLASVVMMVPLMTLRRQERDWNARKVSYSEEFRVDVRLVALVSAILFAGIAAVLPSIRVQSAAEWLWRNTLGPQRVVQKVLEQTFPGVRQPIGPGAGAAGAVLPREHLLGGGPSLGQTAVMRVTIDDPPPIPYGPGGTEFRPQEVFYWRGIIYSGYVGSGWLPGETESRPEAPYAALGPPERPGRRPLRQEFTLLVLHGEDLYAAGDPASLDQAVTVERLKGNGDLVSLQAPADHYHALSLVPQVTAEELAAAQSSYPPEIARPYLALPSNLPQRVADLAWQVTAQADTPFARAMALQAYLRAFPYDLEVAKPPEGRDVVDYFLFDLQRGYCDYFASAMVVMARVVGLPARLAVGYAMGHYDPAAGVYAVTEKDAHAWPELYFPGYGWIPFEPTSGLRALDIAGERTPAQPTLPAIPARSWWVQLQVEARLFWLRWRWWVLGGLALVVGIFFLAWLGRRVGFWRPVGGSAPDRVALCYIRLRQMAPRLGIPAGPADTPAEFAVSVGQALAHRTPRGAWLQAALRRESERAMRAVRLLAGVYEQISYAPALPPFEQMQQAWQEGRRLPGRLWRFRALSIATSHQGREAPGA